MGNLYALRRRRRPTPASFPSIVTGADHPHVENWVSNVPVQAARHLATGIHGGKTRSWEAVAYGFPDGHAETLRFREAFESFERNRFDPTVAR